MPPKGVAMPDFWNPAAGNHPKPQGISALF